jgi:transposase
LTKQQRVVLKSQMRVAGSAAERRRLNVVSLYDAGRKMEWIAETLGCSVATVSLDLQRWRHGRFAGVAPGPRGGSKPKVSEEQFAMLERALEAPPCAVGYNRGTWTLPLGAPVEYRFEANFRNSRVSWGEAGRNSTPDREIPGKNWRRLRRQKGRWSGPGF